MDCMANTINSTLVMVLEIALRCKDLDEMTEALRDMIRLPLQYHKSN